MKTNELKKGDQVVLICGWKATVMDNKKGNIRFAEVFSPFTPEEELGSIYAWDIASGPNDESIELTKSQLKDRQRVREFDL